MADRHTTYMEVRGQVTAAINTAWNPAKIVFFPAERPAEDVFPIVYIKPEIGAAEFDTFTTETQGIVFRIVGEFEADDTVGADEAASVLFDSARLELYAATMPIIPGDQLCYLQKLSEMEYEVDAHNRLIVSVAFSCQISYNAT